MPNQLQFIYLYLQLSLVICQQSFIFSSSVGYYNYRQNANVLQLFKNLIKNGFSEDDIWMGISENAGCCEKNPYQGGVSFIDGNY